jgi:hypothetical protein
MAFEEIGHAENHRRNVLDFKNRHLAPFHACARKLRQRIPTLPGGSFGHYSPSARNGVSAALIASPVGEQNSNRALTAEFVGLRLANVGSMSGKIAQPDTVWASEINDLNVKCRKCRVANGRDVPAMSTSGF